MTRETQLRELSRQWSQQVQRPLGRVNLVVFKS